MGAGQGTALLQVHAGQVGPVDPDPGPPRLPGGAADVVRFFMDVPQWIQIGGLVLGAVAAVAVVILAWRHRTKLRGQVAGLSTPVKAAAVAILVAGGAVAAAAAYQVYDYVEHDNTFCTGCHVMAEAYVRFEESPHAELGCKECHAQPKTESARQLYLWVLERPHEVGPHSPVPDIRCASCHVEGDPERWPQIAASLGHRIHFESDEPDLGELMCVTCHGVSVHEFTPAEATCGECHEAQATVRLGRMAAETDLHCVTCHDFLGDEPATLPGVPEGLALMPARAQCAACHEMGALLRAEELDVDPHGAVCGACHNPHVQETPAQAVETCLGCHEDAATVTIFHTGTHAPFLPDCTACHSAHRWEVEGVDCIACHGTVMDDVPMRTSWDGAPGRGSFAAPSHPAVPIPLLPRARDTDVGSRDPGLDEGDEPANGEAPPVGPPGRPTLRTPEDGRGTTAFVQDTLPPPPGVSRPFLHRQHEAVSCTQCHGTAVEHGVVTVRTARDCAACHHDPGRRFACADCHAGRDLTGPWGVPAPMDLTVWDAPRTRTLPFDHEAHETLACQECHTGPVMLAVETTCAACHADHHRPEADCSRCHVPAEDGAHGLQVHLTCTSSGCHAGSAGERPALTRSLCLTCHAEQRDHEPGLSCHACHMVPDRPPVRGDVNGPEVW